MYMYIMIIDANVFLKKFVKIQYWDTLPQLSLKKVISCTKKIYVKTLCVLFYALMLVDINLIILFA